jgi:hypothetical protein
MNIIFYPKNAVSASFYSPGGIIALALPTFLPASEYGFCDFHSRFGFDLFVELYARWSDAHSAVHFMASSVYGTISEVLFCCAISKTAMECSRMPVWGCHDFARTWICDTAAYVIGSHIGRIN